MFLNISDSIRIAAEAVTLAFKMPWQKKVPSKPTKTDINEALKILKAMPEQEWKKKVQDYFTGHREDQPYEMAVQAAAKDMALWAIMTLTTALGAQTANDLIKKVELEPVKIEAQKPLSKSEIRAIADSVAVKDSIPMLVGDKDIALLKTGISWGFFGILMGTKISAAFQKPSLKKIIKDLHSTQSKEVIAEVILTGFMNKLEDSNYKQQRQELDSYSAKQNKSLEDVKGVVLEKVTGFLTDKYLKSL